ncbi:MAG TPA: transcription termination factor NusA [Spirochaetota bacterium]|nr:transcription termination factor NusA [Spirochaetota bacterium]HOJ27473.1 transcription termination factor NusA [Spirochaetota bacterium]HOM08555.1 transcription termination factor NusA [Spirochaetota bacterium]HPP48374.1 transcription termination factor NusA [Spirochaetota bacterium]HXK64877.1 transcription termination factor NusA [Spirochaetota bacterium]
MSGNFFEALHQIATEKGITREMIEEIVQSAMLSAYKKQYGITKPVDITFDRERNTVKIISRKMVVRVPKNYAEEISLEEAQKIKPDAKFGDEVIVEENPLETFGRIAAQTAKQVILQKIKEAEKNIVYDEYKDKVNELINGYVQRKTKEALYIDLGKTEGIIPAREQSPLEHYKIGDRVKAIVLSVQKNSKGPSVVLSRAHPKFVEKLFEMEIPEIYDGIVKIVNIVREPGMRTKVAVTSDRDDIDSVGACVGMKGVRIQSIVRELEGEKIDVIEYSPNKKVMASNALTPAKVKEIIETRDGGVIAVVDNDQYRLAIGKNGHNARLAAKLCGFNIDIKTEDQYREFLSSSESRALVEQLFATTSEGETPLEELPGLDARTITLLEAGGIFSVEDLVEKSVEDLMNIDGIGEKTAQKIINIIQEYVDFEEEDYEDEQEDKQE